MFVVNIVLYIVLLEMSPFHPQESLVEVTSVTEDAFTQLTSFLAKSFLKRTFQDDLVRCFWRRGKLPNNLRADSQTEAGRKVIKTTYI